MKRRRKQPPTLRAEINGLRAELAWRLDILDRAVGRVSALERLAAEAEKRAEFFQQEVSRLLAERQPHD